MSQDLKTANDLMGIGSSVKLKPGILERQKERATKSRELFNNNQFEQNCARYSPDGSTDYIQLKTEKKLKARYKEYLDTTQEPLNFTAWKSNRFVVVPVVAAVPIVHNMPAVVAVAAVVVAAAIPEVVVENWEELLVDEEVVEEEVVEEEVVEEVVERLILQHNENGIIEGNFIVDAPKTNSITEKKRNNRRVNKC